MSKINFFINNEPVTAEDPAGTTTLLEWIREKTSLKGTKEGCNEGDCGACTVIIESLEDNQLVHSAVNSCILFLHQLHNKSVRTIEGVSGPEGQLHPVQEAMIKFNGNQCGFCTPGIVMSLVSAHTNDNGDLDTILAGNLCRCTGYDPIINAGKDSLQKPKPAWLRDVETKLPHQLSTNTDKPRYIPDSIEAFSDWYEKNPEATLVAGGTDVGLWVTKELKTLPSPCFISDIPELKKIKISGNTMTVGAATTLTKFDHVISKYYPSLSELINRFGSVQIRNAATVGGNIANGSPIGDLPPALIALSANLILRKKSSCRKIPLEEFFVDYGVQNRKSGEFVEGIEIPLQYEWLRCYKLSKRRDQDISAVCGCFLMELNCQTIENVRIAFGGMAAIPKRATKTEAFLCGKFLNQDTILEAMTLLEEDFKPISDMRASSDYRIQSAKNLLLKYFFERNRTYGFASIDHYLVS